jgi:CheY-like chemotaxis protein
MATILVIDDSAFSRALNTKALEDAGYEVVKAGNGVEGLAAVEESEPDCIILDMLMPVMDGVEFLQTFRATNKTLPIIVASADIQDLRRLECEALGISAFVNKPINAGRLVKAVEEALQTCKGECS